MSGPEPGTPAGVSVPRRWTAAQFGAAAAGVAGLLVLGLFVAGVVDLAVGGDVPLRTVFGAAVPADASEDAAPGEASIGAWAAGTGVADPADARAFGGGRGVHGATSASDADEGEGEGPPAGPELLLPPLLGTHGPLVLRLPVLDAVAVGYHEAATTVGLPLVPIGSLLENHNTTRFEPPRLARSGSDYLVLSSRGRRAGPTTAVDIVARDDEPVVSPVTGVVTDVRIYWLYGRHVDTRIEVVADDAPDVRVVLLHVRDATVAAGDRVQAGVTQLAAGPTRFPFASQIDVHTSPERWPHIHLEVQPIDAPRPGDQLESDETDPDGTEGPDAGEG